MKRKQASITRRLIFAILVLETLAAIGLIAYVAHNERHVRYEAFDANLRAVAQSFLGSVQEDVEDRVRLELGGRQFSPHAIFRVSDEEGRVLGHQGDLPSDAYASDTFHDANVSGVSYRFFAISGERIIDPEREHPVRHDVKVIFGTPDARIKQEVFEAVSNFAFGTTVLLGMTTLLIAVIVRALTRPIRELAIAADQISATSWEFNAPAGAYTFAELSPLTTALETSVARLQASFAQQKRFTSDAAHELKTDLAILKSSLQLLSLRDRSAPEYKEGVLLGLGDLTRLERTVQKMLTLARLEQQDAPESQVSEMTDVVLDVVRQSEAIATLNSISLRTHVAEFAYVRLNREDLALLCSNLVMNALQHTGAEGMVELRSKIEGDQVVFEVNDTGEGIREEEADLLFEPFYRSDPSRSRKSGGTGLGLSICKAICDRGGGTIAIRNRVGRGASVRVTFPIHPMI